MQRWLTHRPLVAAFLLLALLAVNTAVFLRSIHIVRQDSRWVMHTHEVLHELDGLLASVNQAESNARGYLLSGEATDRTAVEELESGFSARINRLQSLVVDNGSQAETAKLLPSLVERRMESLRELMALREQPAANDARRATVMADGRTVMQPLLDAVQQMERAELDLLATRSSSADFNYQVALATAALAGLIGIVVLAVSGRMIAEELAARRRAEGQSEEQRQRLAFTLNAIGDAVICVDTAENVTFLNGVAERLTGWTTAESLGRRLEQVFQIINEETRRPVMNPAQKAIQSGSIVGLANHTILITKDGREISIDDSAAPIFGQDGQVTGVVLIFRDISERRTIERMLEEQTNALRDDEKRKNTFLATLAHELRNPLAPISNCLEVMALQAHDAEAVRELREAMMRQVRNLVQLLDDLLDISRVNRNILTWRTSPVDLGEAVRSGIETARPQIDLQRHRLTVAVSAQPLRVQGDAVRLAQVVANLLNNAAKFTPPEGQIRISLEPADREAVIRISDSGIGIEPSELNHIFEMFYQLDPSLTRGQGGLGVGLSLAKYVVEHHGGSISARSEGQGRGSEFVVRLPTVDVPAEAMVPAVPTTDRRTWNPPTHKILVVDDMKAAADTVSRLLILLGQKVRTTHDAFSAFQAVQEESFDVVISDIAMPEMSGYELAGKIRSLPGQERLVLIALTGYGQESDVRRAREAGFDYHIVKPVGIDNLREVLFRINLVASS